MSFDIVRATVLALIQGLTEFLPVSSSAHLILPSVLFGWPDQGLSFDTAVHLGTLCAVVLYFRAHLWQLATGSLQALHTKRMTDEAQQVLLLALATLPVVLLGLLLKDYVESTFRSVKVIATTTIVFGLLLWLADRRAQSARLGMLNLSWKIALVIGCAQVLALLPGVSRSGVTMTVALFCGLNRIDAARFSFLLSIPVIAAAGALTVLELLGASGVNWLELGYGALVSALCAYGCIHFFLRLIGSMGFLPFVIYRLLLGVALWLWLV
ncbi:MAG: undecaprenyl-diphosphate phosphatase [Pseudomonadales bacterium]|jgi:undecaprenyl-diphosphatase|nr:undecaprenyl-diphosphate phosphatase [Pseudomonadales bacterium]